MKCLRSKKKITRHTMLLTGHIDTQHTHTHKCTHRGYISQAARATWYPHGVMMLL